jgi:hypothetical protein
MKKIFVMAVAAMMATVSATAQHREGDNTIQPRVGISMSTLTNWDDAKMKAFNKVMHYYTTHWENFDENLAVKELNMPLDNILLDVATFTEMAGKYVWF